MCLTMKHALFPLTIALASSAALAGEVFIEAESFKSSGGWAAVDGAAAKQRAKMESVRDFTFVSSRFGTLG